MMTLLLAIIYLTFISLGLPDSLLGSAWPGIYQDFGVPVSYAGGVSMIIAAGTVLSSLESDRVIKWLGVGKVTLFSVAMTMTALFGISMSRSFPVLCLWAIPYGLGAGSIDAALNNYVALHFASRHMSWLHCMWGVGASIGPVLMGWAMTRQLDWTAGYRSVALIQAALTAILLFSLPLWKRCSGQQEAGSKNEPKQKPLTLRKIFRIRGIKEILLAFFCYCALEQTSGLWASSYLVLKKGVAAETAAGLSGIFFLGITVGRFLSGFLTLRFSDSQMIRLGQGLVLGGIAALLLPLGSRLSLAGLVLIGLGCAPIYPCIIHSTPGYFGKENSQAIIGVQMAFAYVGILLMPPLFGVLAEHITIGLFPFYLLMLIFLMILMHERLMKKAASQTN